MIEEEQGPRRIALGGGEWLRIHYLSEVDLGDVVCANPAGVEVLELCGWCDAGDVGDLAFYYHK